LSRSKVRREECLFIQARSASKGDEKRTQIFSVTGRSLTRGHDFLTCGIRAGTRTS
jgi:hypothetical protein